ncbi:MAG TPA: NAD(P)-dependent oxidoreductase [Terriglobia bacterium]|nr:NAD(P)-dependent oxidoreductase [Terriglobia bacterium]
MIPANERDYIIQKDDPILITGAHGFIGSRLVETLLDLGFRNLRCFTRSSAPIAEKETFRERSGRKARVEVVRGNLLSRENCQAATKDIKVIYHLAAGRGEKSFPDAFMNSVVTTRNLLDACLQQKSLKRLVNVSSFAVYSNRANPRRRLLDESCPLEQNPELRGEAYCYAKVKQDELVVSYGSQWNIPYVIVRPGYVYGPGNQAISSRVGIGTFGLFLHLGGSNRIPLTYIDNCAEAIALAGLVKGIEGETLNVVDDYLPSSRKFLRLYKRNVRHFKSLYLPHFVSYALCYLWERYSAWSEGQLPPVFNRRRWHVDWKQTDYSNQKLKTLVGWTPTVPMTEALNRYFQSCRDRNHD